MRRRDEPRERGAPPTATAAAGAERFDALASSVAGRPLHVTWGDGPTCTDGQVIELDRTLGPLARPAVLVQAALLGTGALDADRVRPLRGRPRKAERYLREAVPGALAAADHLPPIAWPPVAEAMPAWWGTIRPDRLVRAATPAVATTPTDVVGEQRDDHHLDPTEPDGPAREPRSTLGRQTVDQGRRPSRRRRRQATAGSSSLGDASQGRAVLATSAAPVLRLAGTADAPTVAVESPGRPGEVARYPEWDERRGAYREGWCHVHELPAREARPAPVPHDVAAAVRRDLARVHLDLVTLRRQPSGADLDLDAVVAHRIDVRAGVDLPAHVFRDHRRRRRDLGVLVLVDGSGSTGRDRADGPSVTARVAEAAGALVEGFESLGDRVACQVFRSHGRRRVELTRVKGFEERAGATTAARLGGLRPEGFTRLGAAVRHGARQLVDRSGSRRWLLVVVSDGFPFDDGYEGAHAAADVSRALAEARGAGVGALCLGVGTTVPDDQLRAVFGASTYATGPSIVELGAGLAELVRAALDGADRSRRIAPVSPAPAPAASR